MHDQDKREEAVSELVELGAATELTQGIYAPLRKENLVRVDYRD